MTTTDPTLLDDQRRWDVHVGNVLDVLAELPEESIQTCVTSPPYFAQRDYGGGDPALVTTWPDGWEGQLGHEPSPELFVSHLGDVFDAVHRVLRPDGTLWLNLGDTYAGSGGAGGDHLGHGLRGGQDGYEGSRRQMADRDDLKNKDLIGIPWMAAFELRRRGWWLRRDIIWHKPNPMPDGARDRPTCDHEYVFLFSKKGKGYYYDSFAVAEPTKGSNSKGRSTTRNRRSVWNVASSNFKGAHFATFPPSLIEPMILAGTPERGACSECGAPLHRVIERRGKSVYQEMKDQHGLDAEALTAVSEEQGKSGPRGRVGGTRNERGTTPKLDGPEKIAAGWELSCDCEPSSWRPTPSVVLDPFSGAATTGLVALQHGRSYVGVEAVAEYADLSAGRLRDELGVVGQTGTVHSPG